MSDYAVKNLMEIEDGTGVEGIEGRFSRKFLDSEQLGSATSATRRSARPPMGIGMRCRRRPTW